MGKFGVSWSSGGNWIPEYLSVGREKGYQNFPSLL